MSDTDQDHRLTVADIARLYNVSRMTIYRAIKDGRLPSERVGRSIRVRESAMEAWVKHGDAS